MSRTSAAGDVSDGESSDEPSETYFVNLMKHTLTAQWAGSWCPCVLQGVGGGEYKGLKQLLFLLKFDVGRRCVGLL
uniref:Uncharacterized protein n=1 Tax=Rhizophora mucronata TaxID=61149 RepID=A0A2P2QPQ2_RHIMU